jgi:hypothetical protein
MYHYAWCLKCILVIKIHKTRLFNGGEFSVIFFSPYTFVSSERHEVVYNKRIQLSSACV